ncbi:hypothetical protein [Planobispora longispora]|uniref:Uncharacterized protein n=1 Tax=Planobispora longispora TaxID=28887 RepID=A0A8J3W6U4_9ACTN|nr:hypothetical protein [Planobispora longispora]BFE83747.1 hypothetical protein GCM10020093_063480 [Planobispora longispora]GIH77176.1 hypothetical protein Plo01_36050 [Planobispora longispora]
MQRHRNLYLLPLGVGWLILVFALFIAFFGDAGANDVPSVIAIIGIGLGFHLTAIAVAINDRWPR